MLTNATRPLDTIRLRASWGMVVVLLLGATATAAHAQTVSCPASGYCTRFSATTNGGLTFIGNTLGLSKATGANQPGRNDSIGAFITTNTFLDVGNYPNGTTLTFADNSSAATLSVPAGSTVLYAELTWGGSYAYGNQFISLVDRNGPVTLVTPNGTSSVSPDPSFLRNIGTANGFGTCISTDECLYARSQNVTSLVQAGGNGVYTVRGVPGTVGRTEEAFNSAGWTLAVVYRNFFAPMRNLSLNIGSEHSGNAAVEVSGFCTPESGDLDGQLAVSAMEGDANRNDDQMRFGPNLPLSSDDRLSGPNNLANNFFASQINGDNGDLVTSGTFGTLNANPATGTLANPGRQGWDITKVDVSSELRRGQTRAFVQGTGTFDAFLITALGLQIGVNAPAFGFSTKSVDKTQTFVDDTLTYTARLVNIGPIDATGVVFTDVPPPGTTFVSGSFKRNGIFQPGANPAAGVDLGTVASRSTATVEFKVQVTSVPASPVQYSNAASWTYQYRSCAGQPLQNGTFTTNTVTTTVAALDPTKQVSPASAVPNQTVTYTVTIPNTGTADATNVTLTDAIPMGTTYVAGTTTLNGAAVTDNAGMMPFVSGRLVNSPDAPPGRVTAGRFARVQFQVQVSASATGTVTNTAIIDPDGNGPQPSISRQASALVTPTADLSVTKSFPNLLRATPGTNQVFIVGVTNLGPSNAANVVLTDPTPPGLTFVSNIGACTTPYPCNLGTLAAGASRIITTTYFVPPSYTAPDPIENTVTGSSTTPDPATANNTAQIAVSIDAPIADVEVTKSDGVISRAPGETTTYTITLQNQGPSDVAGVAVSDPVPAQLTGVSWTCTPGPGASCASPSGSGSINTTVSLPVNTSATFSLTGTLAPDAAGQLINTVTTENPPGVGDPSASSATDTDQIVPRADVSVTKIGPASVVPGNTAVYTIQVSNVGPSPAAAVTVSDATPAGLAFVSNAGACTTPFPCNLGTVAAGDTRTITTTVSVPLGYTTPNPIVETASVSSSTPDTNAANNTASAETTVDTRADVAVSKRVAPASALVGDTVILFVDVSNDGPNQASGVVVTDVLPAGLSLQSASTSEGTYLAAEGQWLVGELISGGRAGLVIMALVTQAGTITNLAAKTAANEPDPDLSNDSASATLNAAAAADVAVRKTVDDAMPSVGEVVTFTLTATNHGPSDATGIELTDVLPAGLGFQLATPSQGAYDQPSGTWTVGDLALDASATLTLVATVNSTGLLVNTAEKTAQTEVDPNPLNNQSSVSLNAVATADLEVTKAVSNAAPSVGEEVIFIVKATNLGPSPATGVVVNDVLPVGLTFVKATTSQGSYNSGTGAWMVGNLSATQSAVLALRVRVAQAGTFTNTASRATSTEPDPNSDNDAGSASITASRMADLSVTKTDHVETVVAGGASTYTITVANAGPTSVTGAPVTDTFPAVFTGVTWTCTPAAGSSCGAAAGGGNIATTVDLPAGGSVTFIAMGTVAPDATGTLANTATVTSPADTPDPTLINNSATDTSTITGLADVAVAKTGPSMTTAGTNVVFTVVITNVGPSNATNVVVSDPTPTGLTFVNNTGACTTTFPCSLGTLAPGASATITATYAVPPAYTTPDPIVNQASVANDVVDPAPGNNTDQTSVSLNAPVAEIALTKTDGVTSVVPGTATTYTITVENLGPSAVTGVGVTDAVPAALGNVTWTCSAAGGSCADASGTGSIDTTVDLPVGAKTTFMLTGTVAPEATGQLINTVTTQNPLGFGDPSTGSVTDTDQLIPTANVGITKTGPAVVVPGSNLPYTITVTNAGPSAAASVVVADPTPPGLAFVMNEDDCVSAFPCTLGLLPPGETRTITATFLVPDEYRTPNPIVQTATVSSPLAIDLDGANNAATVETLVDPQADVSISKSVTPAAALVGDTVTFTVRVGNRGPNTATGIVVTDVLPAGLDFVSASPSHGVYLEPLGSWVVGGLNAGDFAVLTLEALVTQPGTITNLAAKTRSDETDPDTGNDSASATVNAAAAADVAVQKTVDDAMPSVGEVVTFTLTATNHGPSDATGVVLTDVLPAGLGFQSATPSQGTTYDQLSGTWTVGDLAVGASASLTLVATVSSTGALVNTAQKTAQTEIDPNPLNDQSSVSLNAVTTADLEVAKAVGNPAPGVGAEITFVVKVLNRGPSAQTGVVVNDALPPGLAFVAAIQSQGSYDETTGVWTVGDLAASQSALLALRALVTQEGPFTNTASVPNSATDPNSANNSAAASGTAALIADLSITKSDGDTTAFPGEPISYVITVENAGPSPVIGAPVTDSLPAAITGVTWTCTATPPGSCGAASGVDDVDTTVELPASGTATIIVTGLISPDATGMLDNIAQVDPPQGTTDPNLDNNVAEDPTDLTPSAAVAITKTGPATATPGSAVTYTLVVTNAGPSAATDVVVVDPTPAGLLFVINAGDCTTAFPCSLGTLEPGGSRTITSSYTAEAGAMVVNVAMVTSPTPDPDIDDNITIAITDVVANADVALTKTGPASVAVGATATYTLLVVNNGPNFANNVLLADALPAGVELVSVVPSQGACQPSTAVDCVLGGLAAQQSVTVTVTVRILPSATGTLINTATVTTETVDPDASNNTASATSIVTHEADVSLTKTAPAGIQIGEALTYVLTATNRGPSPATNVILTDMLPAGVTPGTAAVSQGSCAVVGQTVTCELGDVAADAAATATIMVEVLPTTAATLVNSATVAGAEPDLVPSNNAASATTNIVQHADLSLIKTASPDHVEVGQQITYVLAVTNAGPAPATNVVVTDALPAAVTPNTVTASQGSCTVDGQTVSCALGDLPVSTTATVTITATRELPEAFSNTASVTADNVDPDPADNAGTATTMDATTEDCGNCRDDDGDGLVDAEDPDCCTPQALTVTRARLQPRRSRLRVKATLAPGAFAGIDPRQQDVRLQIRNQDGEAVCCTIPQDQWRKVLGQVYWVRDQEMDLCPPIAGLCLIVPKNGGSKIVIVAGEQTPATGLGSPIVVTLSAGDQCVQGNVTLRSTARGRAVFP